MSLNRPALPHTAPGRRGLRRSITVWLLALTTCLGTTPARPQFTSDIDLFSGQSPVLEPPQVLVIVDNTANWSPMFSREMKALSDTLVNLQENRFRVGLMLFTESGGSNQGPDGAYVRAAVRTLSATYRQQLGNLVTSLDAGNDRSNSGKAGLALAEAYRYFAGLDAVSGRTKVKTDYTGNTSGSAASRAIYALEGNALSGFGATRYTSPVAAGCARNYIIYLSNGAAQDSSADSLAASQALTAAYQALGLDRPPDITGLQPAGSQANLADEWARFMRSTPQAISTYTLDVDPSPSGQGPGWSALLASMASRSGGEYFRIDSTQNNGAQIADALSRVFNQILAVNSVFAAPSLPASLNTRGIYENQVFMGVFRPDADARPRWRGNLKQYRFAYDPISRQVRLVDAAGADAVSPDTGFLAPGAQSFWTSPSNFWINQPLGTPPSGSDLPDGEVAEKGGVAQRLRQTLATSRAGRRLYTCLGCASQPGAPIDLASTPTHHVTTGNSALTSSALGVSTTTERNDLIEWVRGSDNAGDEAGPGDGVTTVRPSIHGDVLHSRPVAIQYGGSTGVVVFYGSNDGWLRAVNGNPSGPGAGEELWGFIPAEHLGRLRRLRSNSPEIRLSTTPVPTTPGAIAPTPRDYFVDGPIGFHQRVNASGVTEQVLLFIGMRRGGRQVYALDVTQPQAPRYLWKRTEADLPVLGQTWSEPRVARVRGRAGPVVILGAGYDSLAEDLPTPGTPTQGQAVLVLDAATGALVRRFDTERSVAADVALVDADYDGYVDRAYAADVGGHVYRIDFEVATPNGVVSTPERWGHYRLATLGTSSGPPRKFFHAPDVVLTREGAAIQLGSGDREKPLASSSADAFFTLLDTRTTKGTPSPAPTPLRLTDLSPTGSTPVARGGCYLLLEGSSGEKVVNAAVTVGGVTYFATHRPPRPSSSRCAPAVSGLATAYAVPVFCQAPTSAVVRSAGLPPAVVAGTTRVRYTDPLTGESVERLVNFRLGGPNSKGSGIDASGLVDPVAPTTRRRYWFLENAR